jgi:hypothetical protein
MRVSRRNGSLLRVHSAPPALGFWGRASAQIQAGALASPPRIPGWNETFIQVTSRRPEHSRPGLHHYPHLSSWVVLKT